MDNYRYKKNLNKEARRPYYKNERRSSKKKDFDLDTLIIDGNTVYEIDDECMKKQMNSCISKKQ